jgi:hypothetical protein
VAAALTCGCGATTSDVDPVASVAVGRIEDSDAVVALVRDGDGIVLYVCGGAATLDDWTRWFHGDAGTVVPGANGWTVEIDDSEPSGVVRDPEGEPHEFVATPVSGTAGLYTAVDASCRTGVVVDADLAAQGVWCDDLGHFAQVTPVTPIDAQGFRVRVALPEGGHDLTVERASTTAALMR